LLIGGAPKNRPIDNSPDRRSASERSSRLAKLLASLKRGAELYGQGRFQEALQTFQTTFADAQAASLPYAAVRALLDLGGCQLALHQYQAALRSLLQARRLSESAGDQASIAMCDANIATLYLATNEVDAAAEWTSRSISRITGHERAEQLAKMQIILASLRVWQGRMGEARTLYQQGIDVADRASDLSLYAIGWHNLGWALL
jgi:tetratricopeptide (TPR) repeat protein